MAFQIKNDRHETENKTIRFPVPLIDKIVKVADSHNISFSSFVIQACEYALNSMIIDEEEQKSK